jgi:DNA modification methylase
VREFDLVEPLVWNKRTNYVLGGHQRLAVLRQAKETHTDVVPVDLDEKRELALMAVLNKPAGEFTPDVDALVREMEAALPDLSKMLGLDSLLNGGRGPKPEIVEDVPPPPPKKPGSKTGDLWLLGDHRLLCGDSTKAEDVARLMGKDRAVLMATDPPYGVDYVGKARDLHGRGYGHSRATLSSDMKGDGLDEKKAAELWTRSFGEAPLTENAAWYVWHAPGRATRSMLETLDTLGILHHQTLIWRKPNFAIGRCDYQWIHEPCFYGWRKGKRPPFYGRKNQTTVIEAGREQDAQHPTQKPVELFAIPIRNHTRKGEIVYEPFSGSGTQIVAAEQLGRRCYAIEVAEQYCDVAVLRWQRLTSKRAVNEKTGKEFPG